MAKKDKADKPPVIRERFDIRVEPDWLTRIERQAARFGVAVSAYIRQGATEKLERDESTDPNSPKGKR